MGEQSRRGIAVRTDSSGRNAGRTESVFEVRDGPTQFSECGTDNQNKEL